jgi:hypothetical protein
MCSSPLSRLATERSYIGETTMDSLAAWNALTVTRSLVSFSQQLRVESISPTAVNFCPRNRNRRLPLHSSIKPDAFNLYLSARTSGKRCTSPIKLASKGDALSLLQTRASGSGRFRSTTDMMTTLFGHRQRAVPSTHPTPKPFATRLRIVASFNPS